jgi:transcription antitermination factor NusG
MWYAIRTMPGAQLPQREYVRDRQYDEQGNLIRVGRLVPSLNPNISAVERALKDAGFSHYMPVERRLIRDRVKADLWKPRRFPLLQGYAFVENVFDCAKLERTPGVAEIVRVRGKPYSMPVQDIATLREIEAECDLRLQAQQWAMAEKAKRLTRKKSAAMFPSGSRVMVSVRGDHKMGTISGVGRDGRLKAILDGLREVSVPVDALELVA